MRCRYHVSKLPAAAAIQPASRSRLATLTGHSAAVGDCMFSPDGRYILSGGFDGTARIWDSDTRANLATLEGHAGRVRASFLADGCRIATCSDDGSVRLWDLDRGQTICRWIGDLSGAIAVSADGRLALGTKRSTIVLLRAEHIINGAAVVTAWKGSSRLPWVSAKRLGAGCPACRRWSPVRDSELGTELPCPSCGSRLKLNPFTINSNWRSIAKAWSRRKG